MHRNAQVLADGTVVTIGGHQVARTNGTLLPRLSIPNDGTHPLIVLRARDEFSAEAQIAAQFLRMKLQDRLQQVPGDNAPLGGAGSKGKSFTHVLHEPAKFLASKRLYPHDDAIQQLLRLSPANIGLETDRVI